MAEAVDAYLGDLLIYLVSINGTFKVLRHLNYIGFRDLFWNRLDLTFLTGRGS